MAHRMFTTAAALAIMAVAGTIQPAAADKLSASDTAPRNQESSAAPAPAPVSVPVMTRIDPQQAVELLQSIGYRARISHADARNVDIETRMAGMTVVMTLVGCNEGRQCSSLQLRLTATLPFFGLTTDPADLQAALVATNRWSHHRRYAVAYVHRSRHSGENVVAFATDHAVFPGTTRDAISFTIRNYADLAGEFAAFMRDPSNRTMPNA
ncbi:YbjN domain-containing protein [Phreatobacter sp.]|uniref:YbjN domain-containing protein n=1 Tax=Phreatobacter sp. TaxID=1966341 RepID=UPI003F6F4E54